MFDSARFGSNGDTTSSAPGLDQFLLHAAVDRPLGTTGPGGEGLPVTFYLCSMANRGLDGFRIPGSGVSSRR